MQSWFLFKEAKSWGSVCLLMLSAVVVTFLAIKLQDLTQKEVCCQALVFVDQVKYEPRHEKTCHQVWLKPACSAT